MSVISAIENDVKADAKKVLSVMETVGKDCEKVITEIQPYLPDAAALAAILFPSAAAPVAAVVNTVDLIQSTVVSVEQKWAASGAATGTGAQKAQDVLTIVTPAVTSLLQSEKITVNTTLIQQIVNGVVAILNVRSAVSTTSAASTGSTAAVTG